MKVYLSSTLNDLRPERQAVKDALGSECIVVESYTADERSLRESCLADVAACDLYIGIVGLRYGFIPPGETLSITQLEYEKARGTVPTLVFIKDADALPYSLSDAGTKEHPPELVESFRQQLSSGAKIASRGAVFKTPEDLKSHVLKAYFHLSERQGEPTSSDWPQQVVESLSTQLNDEFAFHMQAGEGLSSDQARGRYVQGLIRLRPKPGSASESAREGPLGDFLASDDMQILIIGGGGSGKTTILKHLAAEGARQAARNSRAPIYVYLRLASFDRGDAGLDLLLDRISLAAHLGQKEFEVRWREGRRPIVFLLDGLNEVALPNQPSCIQALSTLLLNSPPLHCYVITSRPGGEFEAVASNSTENQRLRVADTLRFGPQQVRQYLKAQGKTDLQSRISGRLEELASNPFLLWAITRTLANPQQETPKSRGSLFRALIDRYIFGEREQSKPKPPTDYNYELVKKPVLAHLALQMSDDGVTVAADGPALHQQIARCLLALDQQREQKRELPLEAKLFMPKDYAAVSFLRETAENGILVRDSGGLRFMHESVQEYFAAVALNTSTVEDLKQRAPSLRLARLDARGPMFETLIAWAGLSTPEKVTAREEKERQERELAEAEKRRQLVEGLREKHPLLAAHLAVEAGLPVEELQKLRHQFLSFTASEHEQRQRLGAMGLAIAPSEESVVVARLIEMLNVIELRDIAKQALEAIPATGILLALVKACTASSKEVNCEEANILRELAIEHSGSLVEILLDVWKAGNARRDRVASLAAFLNAKGILKKDRSDAPQYLKPLIRERLITLAVDAELAGNLQRSADLDALRQRADEVVVADGFEELAAAANELNVQIRERDKVATAHTGKNDAALELLVRDGEPLERAVALDMLVERASPAAVAPIVKLALGDPAAKWLKALESLPREPARRYLASQMETLEGERLARARLLADLLADEPAPSVLESVFQNCSKDLRAFAAGAAGHAGIEGVQVLVEHLGDEVDRDVLEVCVRVLGESRNPSVVNHLLDLLFDPSARQHWGYRWEELLSDSESSTRLGWDGWAALIHNALVDAGGSADQTLERLEHHLRPPRPGDRYHAVNAVHEARRWLPAARAAELLRSAMTHQDLEVRQWAQWSLGSAGHADAWRALLLTELETSLDPGLAQHAARRLEATATTPDTRNLLIATSQSVLRPRLIDPDLKRRAAALELTRQLPEGWIEVAWRGEALSTAEHLLQSMEASARVSGVRALRRFADHAEDRFFTILMNDPDEAVIQCAYDMLGDGASSRLQGHLKSALQAGDTPAAQHIAGRIYMLLRYRSWELDAVRDSSAQYLDTGNCDQCVAALLGLAMLYPEYADGEEWKELGNRARAAFQRVGVEETWQRFAVHARSLDERHRGFVYLIFGAFDQELEQLAPLVASAAKLWPDDLVTLGYCIAVDIKRGNGSRAAARITAVEKQFHDRVDYTWLGDQFAKLDRPQDALRLYRIAVEREPTNDEAHFEVGWFAFLTRDFEGSIEATRHSLKLQPTRAMAEFNLGVALLARGDTVAGEAAYRRGVALERRRVPADARQDLDGALGDFALLPELADGPKDAAARIRIRSWLETERDRIGAS